MTRPEVPAEFIRRIVDELHPLQIWLYGSRAKGEARPTSDWDLLAVLPDDARAEDLDLVPLWQRLSDLHTQRVELIPITHSEFEKWRDALGSLPQIVTTEGVVVYDR